MWIGLRWGKRGGREGERGKRERGGGEGKDKGRETNTVEIQCTVYT